MVPQILQALEERMVGKNLASGLQPGAADPEPVGERLVEFGRLRMLGRIGQGLPVGRPFGGAPVARRVRGERLGNRRARRHLELFDAADDVCLRLVASSMKVRRLSIASRCASVAIIGIVLAAVRRIARPESDFGI